MCSLCIFIIALFLILITDFAVCRIYAAIARKNFSARNDIKTAEKQAKKKKTLFQIIKEYIAGIVFCTIRVIGIIPSFRIRTFLYKNIFLMKVGKNTKIRGFVEFSAPWNIEIGENTMIGQECKFDGRNGLYIGNNVNISDCTAIWTEQHDINDENFACNNSGGKVILEDRVWLGFRSIVLPKCHIKEGTVVASGAIVTKDCDEFSLYAGIPAIKKKDRNKNINYVLDLSYMHFL